MEQFELWAARGSEDFRNVLWLAPPGEKLRPRSPRTQRHINGTAWEVDNGRSDDNRGALPLCYSTWRQIFRLARPLEEGQKAKIGIKVELIQRFHTKVSLSKSNRRTTA